MQTKIPFLLKMFHYVIDQLRKVALPHKTNQSFTKIDPSFTVQDRSNLLDCSADTQAGRSSFVAVGKMSGSGHDRPLPSVEATGQHGSTRPPKEGSSVKFHRYMLQKTRAIDADRRLGLGGGFDAAQHRRGHVAPAGNKGGEPSGVATDHEKVDVVGAGHDRDACLGLAPIPSRQ